MTHNLVFNDPFPPETEVIVEPADGFSSSKDEENVSGNVTSPELLHPPRLISERTPSFSKDDYSNFLGKHRHISPSVKASNEPTLYRATNNIH